jgi:hypothetical protein
LLELSAFGVGFHFFFIFSIYRVKILINMGFCCCKVCRKWNVLGSDDNLWFNLFRERWGEDLAMFYAPDDSKSWKDVYEVQDRGDRVGL